MTRFLLRDLAGSARVRALWVFCAALFLGIALIAACAGLLELVRGGLAAQARLLFGGDAEISTRAPIDEEARAWLDANGEVSLLVELRTMLGTEGGDFTVVELQSVDETYPLYGRVRLEPDLALEEAVALSPAGLWGAAIDPVLAERLGLDPGDTVTVGDIVLEVRALVAEQPDRSFRADLRGPPVLVADGALAATGLVTPTSLVDYEYRVRVDGAPEDWRGRLRAAFPEASWEVRTVGERGELVAERLEEVASVLLLVGFATLLIGGLGVANSIGAYLDAKLRTLATLQSLGARDRQVAAVFVGQTAVLAALASAAGALSGAAVAWLVARALADRLPIRSDPLELAVPTLAAIVFGTVAALAFALPTLGRTLATRPALSIRGARDPATRLPRRWFVATVAVAALLVALLFALVPDPFVVTVFVLAVALVLAALEGIGRGLRRLARRAGELDALEGRFALRMALASLHRPGTALRPMLLSLGTALTLLVASSLVIAATLRALNDTVPERTPALVFYDVQDAELGDFERLVTGLDGFERLAASPLVLGRLRAVDGERLAESADGARALEANDEHKLGYRSAGVDAVEVVRGAWWPDGYDGPPLVAMEDYEADQLGLEVGDRLVFDILDQPLEVELAAIYAQGRLETRFWFEALFSDGALDPFVTRHVGSVWLEDGADVAALNAIAAAFPGVVTLRTARALEAARATLNGASLAVALIAAVSLAASVLVMASVVAVNRQRQVFEASVLHALGTRRRTIVRSAVAEYALLGLVLAVFATVSGGALGASMLRWWVELPAGSAAAVAPLVAAIASAICLALGAWWLARTLAASPAILLRRSG